MILKRYKYIIVAFLLFLFTGFGGISSTIVAQPAGVNKLLEDVNTSQLQEIINSYEGKKAVLINIWATWCGPCVEEFPHIVKLQNRYEDRLQVIFVSTDFEREPALKFLKKQNVDWKTYFSTDNDQDFINAISDKWTGAMPFTKILDKEGNLVSSWENSADFDRFEEYVKKAINLNHNSEGK